MLIIIDAIPRQQPLDSVELEGISPNPGGQEGPTNITDTWDVQRIVCRRVKCGKLEYKVQWEGYGKEADSWEPAKRLREDVPEMVEEFEETRKGKKLKRRKRRRLLQ